MDIFVDMRTFAAKERCYGRQPRYIKDSHRELKACGCIRLYQDDERIRDDVLLFCAKEREIAGRIECEAVCEQNCGRQHRHTPGGDCDGLPAPVCGKYKPYH